MPPMKPATMPTTEPITIASTVAASPTSRLMRAPVDELGHDARGRSCPSRAAQKSDGLAQTGFSVVLIAAQARLVREQRRRQRHQRR